MLRDEGGEATSLTCKGKFGHYLKDRGGLLAVLSRNYLVRLRKVTLVTGSIGLGKSKERELEKNEVVIC